MTKYTLFPVFLFLSAFLFAQHYKKPSYPQYYFGWPNELNPDIVANMGELRNNHWHMGLDIRTNQKVNQNIVAAADGYISFVGIEPLSWGRWIIINHPNGLSTLYGHLNNFEPALEAYVTEHQYETESWKTALDIPPGRFPVKKGDFISYSGTTGGSQGPHVHWEVIDTKSGKRLNPALFGIPIVDVIPPVAIRIAMYDRNNSVFDQSPQIFKLTKKKEGIYTVDGNKINTSLNHISFSVQAYDTRNGTRNQDGIYSARLYIDNQEISSFFIDSIDYATTRYVNCQIDYKVQASGGSWMQHISKLPGDHSGIYYDMGDNGTIHLSDTAVHNIRIDISDTKGNISTIRFSLQNNSQPEPLPRQYELFPNRLNSVLQENFEAYFPMYAFYDRMNTGYTRVPSTTAGSVSAKYKLGENDISVHSNFEIRIKPDKVIAPEDRNRIVIKSVGKNTTVHKATWNGDWLITQFRDFGIFEAFIDRTPPVLNSIGNAALVDLTNASRIAFTPTDNFGIADFKATVDGKWLRFTNDKGRTWVYYFDSHINIGEHSLNITVTDIAGNTTTRTWKFIRERIFTLEENVPKSAVKKSASTKKLIVAHKKAGIPKKKPITKKHITKTIAKSNNIKKKATLNKTNSKSKTTSRKKK